MGFKTLGPFCRDCLSLSLFFCPGICYLLFRGFVAIVVSLIDPARLFALVSLTLMHCPIDYHQFHFQIILICRFIWYSESVLKCHIVNANNPEQVKC